MKVRQPAVAGTFYPAEASRLRDMVERFLAGAERIDDGHPKAVIVPHAGYVYSGPIAASAYTAVGAARRVLLIGPSHFVWFGGVALPGVDAFRTPLGDVALSDPIAGPYQILPAAHQREHSLEVQLPFLQVVLGQFELIPIAIGDATAVEVAEICDRFGTDPDTLIVVSSDLSHYLDYREAGSRDADTARLIVERDGDALTSASACGVRGIQGILLFARRHDLDIRLVDLRNSGDTQGDHRRVVGYGAFLVG
jgi:AmmeMemoRadiSam system protein B